MKLVETIKSNHSPRLNSEMIKHGKKDFSSDKYFYYINDDKHLNSKLFIRRVKRLSKIKQDRRDNYEMLKDLELDETIKIKITKIRKNRNSIKKFYHMKLYNLKENHLSLKKVLNTNFSERERNLRRYKRIFEENHRRISELVIPRENRLKDLLNNV